MPAVLSRYVSPALPAAASSTEAAKGSFNSNEQSLAELADIKAPLATADMDGSAPLVYNYVPDADALPEDREDLDLVALPGADQQTANADSERTGQNASVSESIATNFDTTLTQSGKEIAEEMTHRTRCKLQKDWKRIRRWAKKNELQEADLAALWSRAEEEICAKQSNKLRYAAKPRDKAGDRALLVPRKRSSVALLQKPADDPAVNKGVKKGVQAGLAVAEADLKQVPLGSDSNGGSLGAPEPRTTLHKALVIKRREKRFKKDGNEIDDIFG
ncbi:hypothetical protein C6P46_002591 [Rhodotorula mucilaginosa]|uniref:Uncharacterized protein n=1 Tax=Rhodotorula mucilaginosa TaxID=5537 RepID=A0A9P7BAH7_RHOMI|nr:hypothetical protein C6P46_002591 [Rhodotorula mucilaginosa]